MIWLLLTMCITKSRFTKIIFKKREIRLLTSATQSALISAFDNILDTVALYAHEAKNLAKQFGDNRTLLKSYRKLQAVEFNHNNMNRAFSIY